MLLVIFTETHEFTIYAMRQRARADQDLLSAVSSFRFQIEVVSLYTGTQRE